MPNVILGNILSGFAAGFLILSGLLRRKRLIYSSQCAESFFLFLAQIAFYQFGAAACLLVSILKNMLLAMGKYGRLALILVLSLTLSLGILCNTGGNVGLLPVAASAIFCISGYLARGDVAIKISISVNLILWCIYSLMIADIVSFAVNTVALVINIFVAVRLALEDHELQS